MLNEELTDKTIKSGDKIKVARVIADMLGVEKAESMSPEVAVNTGLRSIKNKRMTPEMTGIVRKMLSLAQEVDIKYDHNLAPKGVEVAEQFNEPLTKKQKDALMAQHKAMMGDMAEEPEVNTKSKRNAAGNILRYNDFLKLKKVQETDNSDPNNLKKNNPTVPGKEDNPEAQDRDDEHKDNESDFDADDRKSEMGKALVAGNNDQLRRRKIHYKTEELDFQLDEAADMASLRKQLDKHTELAIKANRAGDDELTKKHQGHMNKIKTQMAKMVEQDVPSHSLTNPNVFSVEEVDTEEVTIEEDMASADYKINPKTGRKYRAHKINFANSGKDGQPQNGIGAQDREDMKEEVEEKELDISDAELDKMADTVDHEDDILDCYDDNELKIVDQDTGEEIKEEVNEEQLNEVLSRSERMRARIRFLRTAAKRERRLKIVLTHRSDAKTISKRARRLAVKMIKERIARKPLSKMNVGEKERIEKMLQSRSGLISRLAMKLVPRIRRVEADRMSHSKSSGSSPAPAF